MNQLPIALVSPHGGFTIPPELHGRIALTPDQIFNEADAYVNDLFDFREQVLYFEPFPYARAVLDVNRPAEAHRHHRPGDGVVKRITSYGAPVFAQEPEPALEQALIHRYWRAWHERLARIEQDERVKLVFDCHSMAAVGPTLYDDPAQLRPRVQTANLGDGQGELVPARVRISAPPALTCWLAETLGDLMADVPSLTAVGGRSAVNHPFYGGWNLWAHGRETQPWIMVEINRGLYIGAQSGETPIVQPDPARMALLRQKIWGALTAVVDYWLSQS